MRIETLEGVRIDVLPECAVCYASYGCKSPLELDECPVGNSICHPDGCENYDEIWQRFSQKESTGGENHDRN